MLASGGLMISFSGLGKLISPENFNSINVAEEWNELTGYIKITPDNIVKILKLLINIEIG